MTENKRTPGPWKSVGIYPFWGGTWVVSDNPAAQNASVVIVDSDSETHDADVNLILAAPKLLQACIGLLTDMEEILADRGPTGQPLPTAFVYAREAILDALGLS